MRKMSVVAIAVVGLVSLSASSAWSISIDNGASDTVALSADPMLALERNRSGIVERLVSEYRGALAASGIAEVAFRNALTSLRIDQLLAASLVNSLQEVSTIVAASPSDAGTVSRYVAVAPTNTLAALPAAEAYLVRNGERLSVVKPAQLQLTADTQLVGYFVAPTTAVVVGIQPKDGPGSGANSWIGYTAGSNVASGAGSAVAAGTFNAATTTNASVFAGQSNVASGVSSLVIGGFDNRATAIDSLIGAGAGNRATGARSVVVGGGYNLASGQWSFIGGGGRDFGTGVAGTNTQDNVASGSFSVVTGGQGNRAGSAASGAWSTVAGGRNNVANPTTSSYSTVSGGTQNVADKSYSTVSGGAGNTASGSGSAIPGGVLNVASGTGSVAMGQLALTESLTPTPHNGSLVYSDGTSGKFRSIGHNSFNVLATGGVRFVTFATTTSGEAVSVRYVDITSNNGYLQFAPADSIKIMLAGGDPSRNIGVQPANVFYRTNDTHAWYLNGTESANTLDPGLGGAVMATLSTSPLSNTVTGTFRALAFTATSDRAQKTNFTDIDAKSILAKVADLPLATWSYKTELRDGIRHIGPTAQDFRERFGVGYDDKSIATVDADGVALAAIKGLVEEVRQRDIVMESLRAEVAAQRQRLAELEQQNALAVAARLQEQGIATIVLDLRREVAALRQLMDMAAATR